MFRAIEVYTGLTDKKREIVQDIIISYRKTALKIANYQWKLFFQIGSRNEWFLAKSQKAIWISNSTKYEYETMPEDWNGVFFSTDRGDLLGRDFYLKIREYTQKIDKLQGTCLAVLSGRCIY